MKTINGLFVIQLTLFLFSLSVISAYGVESSFYGTDTAIQTPDPSITFNSGVSIPHYTMSEDFIALFPIKQNGLFGYMNVNGKVVIEPQFKMAYTFDEGIARVVLENGMHRFINQKGELVWEQYDFDFNVHACSEDLITYYSYDNDQYGFVTRAGEILYPAQFEYTSDFSGGFAVVQRYPADVDKNELPKKAKDKFKMMRAGVIDKKGNLIVDFIYAAIFPFNRGYAAAQKEADTDKWGVIDTTGKIVVPFEYESIYMVSEHVFAYAWKDSCWGYLDLKLNFIPLPGYHKLGDFSEGFASVRNRRPDSEYDYYSGFINEKYELVIPFQFDYACDFSDGMACIEVNNLYGAIDSSGKIVVQPHYYDMLFFYEGFASARVEPGGLYGFIDKKGKWLVEPQFTDICDFENGLAAVGSGGSIFSMEDDAMFGYINTKGEFVWPLQK